MTAAGSGFVASSVLTLALAACEGGDSAGGASVARDSAGVRIVESSAPRWTDRTRWRVDAEPVLDLGGGPNPAEPYLYQRIIGVMRLDDGRLLVTDGQAAELRFYDAEGRHLRTSGGHGDGPGEMRVAYGIWRRQGDTLVVSAFGAQLHEFAPSGDYVRSWRAPGVAASPSGMMNTDVVLRDGSLIVTTPPVFTTVIDGRPQFAAQDSSDLFIVDPLAADSARLLLRHPSRPRIDGKVPVFGSMSRIAAAERHVVYGMSDEFALSWYGTNGRLERIYRRAWEPVPVTDAVQADYRETNLAEVENIPPQLQAGRRRQIAEAVFAPHFPAFDRLLVDRVGNLWVQLPRTDGRRGTRDIATEWSVFDTSGVWLGEVTMPVGIDVREIGDGYVAAVWQDELDVHHARVYELTKP